MTSRILVVEDDRALRGGLVSALPSGGYEVEQAADGSAGVLALKARSFDVVLLDIGLPFVDGWHVLSTLEGRRIPSVIVISARGDQADKVRALDMGADDYLAKPFGSDELLARIRAVLRRAQPPAQLPLIVRAADITVDLQNHSVLRGEQEVRLSATEYLLLAELARPEVIQTVPGRGYRFGPAIKR